MPIDVNCSAWKGFRTGEMCIRDRRKGFRAAEIFIPLPVIELWQRILQVGPRLFGGKFLAGHVLHADLDQIV